jgi:hypothetical protein
MNWRQVACLCCAAAFVGVMIACDNWQAILSFVLGWGLVTVFVR